MRQREIRQWYEPYGESKVCGKSGVILECTVDVEGRRREEG